LSLAASGEGQSNWLALAGDDEMTTRFKMGLLCITRTALDTLHMADVYAAIHRHSAADWGEVCDEDRAANDYSLEHDLRLLSSYTDRLRTKFWIITEADRSATTILLPDDY
jgi:hypothetical protein